MEKFQELREMAKRKIQIADHMLTQTYPLVQDPKLLLTVLENVFKALYSSMSSLLQYERLFKRIPSYHESFDAQFQILDSRLSKRLNINQKYVKHIKEIYGILRAHQKSPMEFIRKDKFVICEEDYKMKSLSLDDIKNHIQMAKEFVSIVDRLTRKNEELFAK